MLHGITENLWHRLQAKTNAVTIMLGKGQDIDASLFSQLGQGLKIVFPVGMIAAHIDQHAQR
ncbi:MAG: hypothetical protein COW19_05535 [Zetaproteobacteria bacterium CG12_big_fil_rev_8_21_14_0_65_55_1124]|nr:MAG: hypothetical protein AUJ58_07825 [Zetaproteobacteria bacterium CG1_02_55_237]PIW42900.1 MAG: hypothetical protein COW19_05535 [Zetaproteobacteria bacterium CG12_big_fil_rev_8_21_14_0_65_55_1124]PJB79778.1 MAG: hypothetical protein CO089_09160 [Zetaproteobacteria bacterium CG_4_9_14_0_8_um_filter_55_31]